MDELAGRFQEGSAAVQGLLGEIGAALAQERAQLAAQQQQLGKERQQFEHECQRVQQVGSPHC